jgi:hypothetical protein
MNLDRLRASLARENMLTAYDNFGQAYSGEEAAAYYRGREHSQIAVDLLRKAGVLLPNLEGFHDTQDVAFKQSLVDIVTFLYMDPKVVYNPGCGSHVSLARAFPGARAIFVDNFSNNDTKIAEELIQNGFELYVEDMQQFLLPEGLKADVTLILNAGYLPEEQLDKVVAGDGIVIINDWHGGATYMIENCRGYELVRGLQSEHNVYDAQGSRDDANTLYVFQKIQYLN